MRLETVIGLRSVRTVPWLMFEDGRRRREKNGIAPVLGLVQLQGGVGGWGMGMGWVKLIEILNYSRPPFRLS